MKVIPNKTIHDLNANFEAIYAQVSPEIAVTFTKDQLVAIKNSFVHREWNEHSLDLRISVPIPGIRFYLVLLAGEERRSKQRLQYEKNLYPLWTPGNILFLIVFLSIVLTGSFPTLLLVKSIIPTKINSSFPTSIPSVTNESDCEQFNRNWSDNKCWDYQHSPTF